MAKEELTTLLENVEARRPHMVAPGTVPTPTLEYRAYRRLMRAANPVPAPAAGPIPLPLPHPIPLPIPALVGPRVLIWKQDPTVGEIGIRKTFLPRPVSSGPRDARINVTIGGMTPVVANALGDFIQTPLTAEFDAVHTFAVVRQTLTMYQRALAVGTTMATVPWRWNSSTNSDPIQVHPRHSQMQNAFYSPGQRLLAFGHFLQGTTQIFTCRSLDIVAHEAGHAVLDGLKPAWISASNPQTGGLHESFGDLTAIFLALSQFDQVEAVIAQTKGNLHDKTFLSDLAEQFGLALGRPNGLRNADNDLKLSQVSNEVHAISQVFTGAIYDILADVYAIERTPVRDDAIVLYDAAKYVLSLVLRAIVASPNAGATYADVANQMLTIAKNDGKPIQYRNAIFDRFTVREVGVTVTPLAADASMDLHLEESEVSRTLSGMPQDRTGCCGTMTLPENNGIEALIEEELTAFRDALKSDAAERSRTAAARERK
jgi:hypothetical protein